MPHGFFQCSVDLVFMEYSIAYCRYGCCFSNDDNNENMNQEIADLQTWLD